MIVGVPKETYPGERRVALVPAAVQQLSRAGLEMRVQAGAGVSAGYPDGEYVRVGAAVCATREEAFAAEIVAQVRALGAAGDAGLQDLSYWRRDQIVVAMMDPLSEPEAIRSAAGRGAAAFALELMPRITRAQSMDVLSSQANLAGYKAVLMAAGTLPRVFPMMMTAAGTITPARVFVVGAGVAGLQAIATAKRLGAVVSAYDVRAVVKEQVESVGARFVELEVPAQSAEGTGGYARALDEEARRRQLELMEPVVADHDVVITTAAVPGMRAPLLISRAAIEKMRPGSVVIDLAAERGGNCELTRPGETYEHQGVTIVGPLNVPATLPYHASQLYSRNVVTFLAHLVNKGELSIDRSDEITRDTLVTYGGEVLQPRIREKLGLPPLEETAGAPAA